MVVAGVIVSTFLGVARTLRFGRWDAILILMTAGRALTVFGRWRLTRPDPSGAGERSYGSARRVVRATLLVGAASLLVPLVPLRMRVPELTVLLAFVNAAAAAASAVGLYAELTYLRHLAGRMPDDALQRRARLLIYGLAIPYLLLQSLSMLQSLSTLLARRDLWFRAFEVISIGVILPAIIVLVFGIIYLLFLRKIARRLRADAAASRAIRADPQQAGGADPAAPAGLPSALPRR
jgi:hypothetical protein